MALVVETGAGVAGANSLVSPGFAAEFHAGHGGLTDVHEASVTAAVFDPVAGTVTVPGQGANVPANSIVLLEGAGEAGNVGYAYAWSVSGDILSVRWLDDMVAETVDVSLVVWDQSGWWSTWRRLEASLVNGTEWLASKPWHGTPVSTEQGTPFPREGLVCDSPSNQYYALGHQFGDDEVPLAVRHACCHVALEDLTSSVNAVRRPGTQLKSKRVGPISKSFDNPRGRRQYPYVNRMLRGLYRAEGPFIDIQAVG